MTEYSLPSKIIPALRRIRFHYQTKGEHDLSDLIDAAHIYIEPSTEFDNWNGGTYGHDVFLFVPLEMMGLVDLDNEEAIFQKLREHINKATSEVENEYVRSVYIKPVDESDPQYQASLPFTLEPRAKPEDTGLWKENALRLFISHRDEHKKMAHELAESLEAYGVSGFVAHDAIKPMKKWQQEILNGLLTMEVMLILLTDGFHDSVWTNQEVGYALGRSIPIIIIKVGKCDPQGFIAPYQAQKVSCESIYEAAPLVQKALINEIGQKGRIKEILIEAFVNSKSYIDAINSLKRLTQTIDHLTDKEFLRVANGYSKNDQLYGCVGIHNRGNWFKRYLEDATGKRLEFKQGKIIEIVEDDFDRVPF